MKLSPMMQHYIDTKKEYQDCILFYRLGDFYEMFFDDAILVSKELELTLTGKSCGLKERAPMCGIPHHSAEIYISKLVEKGYKVAICEQVADENENSKIMKREVIKIITPGTVTSFGMLNENENNFLASIFASDESIGISYCDISTGELYTTYINQINNIELLLNEIVRINPKELIFNEELINIIDVKKAVRLLGITMQEIGKKYFNIDAAKELINAQLVNENAVKVLQRDTSQIKALGAILAYITETQKNIELNFNECIIYNITDNMMLDKSTLRNLEILESLYEKSLKGSLLGVLDKTKTAMGSRLLRMWIKAPLKELEPIVMRHKAVATLHSSGFYLGEIRKCLDDVYDFQRLLGKINAQTINGKDLIALKSSLLAVPRVKELLLKVNEAGNSSLLKLLDNDIFVLDEVISLIDKSILIDAPHSISEGGVIKDGFNAELDELKSSIKGAKDWIASLEDIERERTKIKTLKVGYNKVFGYYLEVPKSQAENVPEFYIRKQTLVNNERYITAELKEMEGIVLNAQTKINKLEYDIFCEVRAFIQGYSEKIQKMARALATIDVLSNFAYISKINDYTEPVMDESYDLVLEAARHPVIEHINSEDTFIPNDVNMNNECGSFMLITGPNMAGKSTYMRMVALTVLMAQIGCFVPCKAAKIGVVDQIFTRIGASDNLSQGQSTFFVEMSELSYILNSATDKSLIILDEIGRGTSTYDGLAIAWSSVEYLCNFENPVRSFFATHYHELTELENTFKRLVNYNVKVVEDGKNVIFLHKIVKGRASQSYGIHVASLAGVPKSLLKSAKEKLGFLEAGLHQNGENLNLNIRSNYDVDFVGENRNDVKQNKYIPLDNTKNAQNEDGNGSFIQLNIFDSVAKLNESETEVIELIKDIDILNITPIKALELLDDIKKRLES